MSKQRTILKVIRQGTKWVMKSSRLIDGWTLYDQAKSKAEAIKVAFKYAKRMSPAVVRIYSAAGKTQVESEW
jgi:hypothetical protein